MLNVMVTGLLCISMLLVASSCNLCLFTVKFYWNIKKKKKKNLIFRHLNLQRATTRTCIYSMTRHMDKISFVQGGVVQLLL